MSRRDVARGLLLALLFVIAMMLISWASRTPDAAAAAAPPDPLAALGKPTSKKIQVSKQGYVFACETWLRPPTFIDRCTLVGRVKPKKSKGGYAP